MHRGWRSGQRGAGRSGKKLTEALVWRLRYSEDDLRYMRLKQAPQLADEVTPDSWFYWQAYHHLRGSRQIGMGVGAIPFDAIAAYCDWARITCPVRRAMLARVVMTLDNTEREHGAAST